MASLPITGSIESVVVLPGSIRNTTASSLKNAPRSSTFLTLKLVCISRPMPVTRYSPAGSDTLSCWP